MKKLGTFLFVLLLSAASFGQTLLSPTTLSAAITSTSSTTMVVASATGFTANTTYAYIADGAQSEFVAVTAVNSTTIGVIRGYGGTRATTHASSALVFVGPATYFRQDPFDLSGSCTRANIIALPRWNIKTGNAADCLGGVWVVGPQANTTQFRIPAPNTGGTAYTSINTNGTTLSATTQYCTGVYLPDSKLLTGLGVLNGTTAAGTDKHIMILYDASGNKLANSAVAGVATSGASTYQTIAFTSTFYAVGPANYFACLQTNGATDTVRMVVTGTQDTFLTKGVTGQTFGTIVAITVPTTFTTAVGPYVEFY